MPITTSSNVKVCATCDYCAINRTPKMGGFVIVNEDKGVCYLTNSLGVPKYAMYTCNAWKKWGVLK